MRVAGETRAPREWEDSASFFCAKTHFRYHWAVTREP